jgi:hypothetical protein
VVPWRAVDAHNVCADSHYSDESSVDPNPHQNDKSNPDAPQCEKTDDPDPHQGDVDLRRMACKVPTSWRGYTRERHKT